MNNAASVSPKFRVPKIKSKDFLEKISLSSYEFKSGIHRKLMDSCIRSRNLEKNFTFTSAWLINNNEAENRYIKRRQLMRKDSPTLQDSIGFIYISSEKTLIELAIRGRIKVGNIVNSHLGTGSMGVSVNLHANLYHPGDSYGHPKNGFLVIVKYLKGRINFVQFDPSPMEPQPQYDCHMLKYTQISDKNCILFNAFHMTQAFIYEYNEDGDIVEYPSQILPFAAVKFWWSGENLYPIISQLPTKPKALEIKNKIAIVKKTIPTKPLKKKILSRFDIPINQKNHKKDSTLTLKCQLVLSNWKDQTSEIKILSIVYMYMTNPVIFPQLYNSQWKISGIMEIAEFEKNLTLIQKRLRDKSSETCTDFFDPLSQDLIVSTHSPTPLTLADNKTSDSLFFNDDTSIPKFITYIRVVPDCDHQAIKNATKLIELLHKSNSVAQISLRSSTNDQQTTILVLFPDGSFSKKLGIQSSEAYMCYFHGLLFHFQHPEFSVCCKTKDLCEEKSIYFNGLSHYRKQAVRAKFNSTKPIIDLNILKQTSKDQSVIQKDYFSCLLKLNIQKPVLKYPTISNEVIKNNSISINQPPIINIENTLFNNAVSSNGFVLPPIVTLKTISEQTIRPQLVDLDQESSKEIPYQINIVESIPSVESSLEQLSNINCKKPSINKVCKESKKRKVTCQTETLKSQLYNIFKKPLNIAEDENRIVNEDLTSCSVSKEQPDFEFLLNDLVPLPKRIQYDFSDLGKFSELIFINEGCATVENSNRALFIKPFQNMRVKKKGEYEKMWNLNRSVFRKAKQISRLSVYQG